MNITCSLHDQGAHGKRPHLSLELDLFVRGGLDLHQRLLQPEQQLVLGVQGALRLGLELAQLRPGLLEDGAAGLRLLDDAAQLLAHLGQDHLVALVHGPHLAELLAGPLELCDARLVAAALLHGQPAGDGAGHDDTRGPRGF
eukprot:scaffold675442_cov45-Prasinocladus_malaysianus.AAC.1